VQRLSLKPADRPERRNQQPQKEEEQRDHRGRRYVIPLPDHTDEVFGTHNTQYALIELAPRMPRWADLRMGFQKMV